jgi:hypothetical protein
MRTLELDFRRRPRPAAAGWGLLALGMLAAAAALWAGQHIAADTAVHQATVHRIERIVPDAARAPLSRAETKARDTTLADMRRVQDQLKLPWGELFATLEGLASKDVALLSLTPDARKRQLRLSAEARDLAAMLEFHRQLEDSAALHDVALISHEIVEHAQGRPVRFSLIAAWGIDDARP